MRWFESVTVVSSVGHVQAPITTPGPKSRDPKAPTLILSIAVVDILVTKVDGKVPELVGIMEGPRVVTDIVGGPGIITGLEYFPVGISILR